MKFSVLFLVTFTVMLTATWWHFQFCWQRHRDISSSVDSDIVTFRVLLTATSWHFQFCWQRHRDISSTVDSDIVTFPVLLTATSWHFQFCGCWCSDDYGFVDNDVAKCPVLFMTTTTVRWTAMSWRLAQLPSGVQAARWGWRGRPCWASQTHAASRQGLHTAITIYTRQYHLQTCVTIHKHRLLRCLTPINTTV